MPFYLFHIPVILSFFYISASMIKTLFHCTVFQCSFWKSVHHFLFSHLQSFLLECFHRFFSMQVFFVLSPTHSLCLPFIPICTCFDPYLLHVSAEGETLQKKVSIECAIQFAIAKPSLSPWPEYCVSRVLGYWF